MSAVPQVPPIPAVPLVDPSNWQATREWWRWFSAVVTFARAQGNAFTPNVIPVLTGVTNTLADVSSFRTIIRWRSSTVGPKTQIIPAGDAATLGHDVVIIAQGDTMTYPITISPVSGTINGVASFVLNQNFEAVALVSDGTNDWAVT